MVHHVIIADLSQLLIFSHVLGPDQVRDPTQRLTEGSWVAHAVQTLLPSSGPCPVMRKARPISAVKCARAPIRRMARRWGRRTERPLSRRLYRLGHGPAAHFRPNELEHRAYVSQVARRREVPPSRSRTTSSRPRRTMQLPARESAKENVRVEKSPCFVRETCCRDRVVSQGVACRLSPGKLNNVLARSA